MEIVIMKGTPEELKAYNDSYSKIVVNSSPNDDVQGNVRQAKKKSNYKNQRAERDRVIRNVNVMNGLGENHSLKWTKEQEDIMKEFYLDPANHYRDGRVCSRGFDALAKKVGRSVNATAYHLYEVTRKKLKKNVYGTADEKGRL